MKTIRPLSKLHLTVKPKDVLIRTTITASIGIFAIGCVCFWIDSGMTLLISHFAG